MTEILEEKDYRLSKFCDALSNGVRLKLILLLRNGTRNVSSLSKELKRDRSTISRHLSILAHHDLVQSETDGRKNFYSLKRPKLIDQFLELKPLLRREK